MYFEYRLNKMENNHYIEDWLAAKTESSKTEETYISNIEVFSEFAKERGQDFYGIVADWRRVKRLGEVEREVFLETWSDIIRAFNTYVKKRYAPLTVKNFMATLKSFLGFWNIPLSISLPKRACVIYHNRDLTREELRQILTFASARDRVIWLVMAESGMRAETAVGLKYWQVKEDFEKGKVPMKILLPSSSLKDHVGDRFTFIGEDGYRALKNYLELRLPLSDDDFVFASEKQGKVKGEQFSVASLSVKFNRIVQKLGLDKPRGHKPKSLRLHSLRKYFRNHMNTDSSYIKFWMGHSLGVDAHYITRNVEVHRREYLKGYPYLRVFEPPEAITKTYVTLSQLEEQLRKRDQTIFELKATIQRMENMLNVLISRPSLQIDKEALSTTEKLAKKLSKEYVTEEYSW